MMQSGKREKEGKKQHNSLTAKNIRCIAKSLKNLAQVITSSTIRKPITRPYSQRKRKKPSHLHMNRGKAMKKNY